MNEKRPGTLPLQEFLLRSTQTVVSILDGDGCIVAEYGAVEDMSGFDARDLIGRSAGEFLHEEDLVLFAAWFDRVKASRELQSLGPIRLRRATGEWTWCEVTAANYLDDGEVGGIVCSIHDVTWRLWNERRLAIELAVTRAVAGSSFEEAARTVIEAVCEHTGWNSGELHLGGKAVVTVPHDAEWASASITHEAAIVGGTPVDARLAFHASARFITDAAAEAVLATIAEQLARMNERLDAEHALRERERRYRQLFENNAAGVFLVTGGCVHDCNDALAKMLGYGSREELIGAKTVDFFADPRERLAIIGRLNEERAVHHIEMPLVRADGAPLWTLTTISIVSDAGADVVYQGTVVDITAARATREALAESEQRYRTLAANFPNGAVGIFDHDLRFVVADGQGLEDVGLSPAALERRRVRDVFADLAETIEPYYRAALAGVPSRFSCAFRDRQYLVHTLPLRDAAGVVYAGLFMTQEVTLQKAAEERSRRAEARLQAIVAAAADALVMIRDDGRIDSVNPAAERMFGWPAVDAVGQHAGVLFDPEQNLDLVSLLAGGEAFRELDGLRRDGSVFPVEVSFRPTGVSGPRIWVGVMRDLTQRKEAESRLAALAAVPEENPNPIVEIDRDGRTLYANPAAREHLGDIHAQHPFAAGLKKLFTSHETRLQRTVVAGERTWAQDVFAVRGGERLRIFARDVTSARLAEEKLARLGRLYSILARVNEAAMSAPGEIGLYRSICETAVETGEIRAAAVVVRDPISGYLKPIAAAGADTRFIAAASASSPASSEPVHAVLRDGTPATWKDDGSTPAPQWQLDARRRGFTCAAAFPLRRDGAIAGALAFYSANVAHVQPEELRLLGAIAAEVTVAVESIDVERRRGLAEDALARERDFIAAVLETADALVLVADRGGRIIRFNRACERLTGYTSEEVRQRLVWELLLLPANVSEIRPRFESEGRYETPWLTKEGARRLVAWSTAPLRDRAGLVDFVVVTGIDVTEARLAEEALRRSEQEYRAIVSNTSNLAAKISSEATVVQVSPSVEAILGYRPEELIGRPAFYFAHADDSVSRIERLQSLLAQPGAARNGTIRVRHKDNTWRWLETSATSVVEASGECAVVLTARDVTERHLAEKRGALQFAVTTLLSEAATVDAAIAPLLETFGSILGWDVVEFWRLDRDLDRLRFETMWQRPGALFARLLEANHGLELPLTGTIPGRAWTKGVPEWMSDVAEGGGSIPRLPVFRAEELRSAVAIPILGGEKLSGVIILLSVERQPPDPALLTLLEYLSSEIAQFAERRWAEIELHESRRRLSEAQRIAHVGDWTADWQSGAMQWSPELYRIFDMPADFTPSTDAMMELVDPQDRELVSLARIADGSYAIEYRLTNGRIVSERGERSGSQLVGTVQDVTEQRRADEQLRKLSSAVEQSADMIMITDAQARIEYVNSAFERITGFTKEEVIGRNPNLLQSGRLRPAFYARMWRLLAAGEPFRGVFVNRKKSREEFYEDKTITPLRDARGEIVSYVASGFDTTADRASRSRQKKLQEDLHHAIVEWQLTFDAIDAPIVLLDSNGAIQRLNTRALDLLGGDFRDQIGRSVFAIANSPFWTAVAELAADVRATRRPVSRQLHDGRVWDLAVTLFETSDTVEERVIVIARDVTGIVELQDSLRRSESMAAMGALVAGVAHEVRNPLFGMSATLDAFETEVAEGAYAEYIAAFRDQIARLNVLMRDLLEYGRSQRLKLGEGDFGAVIREAVENTRALAENRGVAVRGCMRGRLPSITMDPRRLRQAIENLIENAIEHSPAGARVSVVAKVAAASRIVLTVMDEGSGVAAEDIPRLFDPFFTKRRGGTGLGLPIVKRIVEEHGGTIAVENRRRRGAVATIVLPLSGAAS